MKDSKSTISCYWSYRFDFIGIALIGIATFLTIVTLNRMGVVTMFIVGAVLCGHKYFAHCKGKCGCACACCDPDHCDEELLCQLSEILPASKKTEAKKTSK